MREGTETRAQTETRDFSQRWERLSRIAEHVMDRQEECQRTPEQCLQEMKEREAGGEVVWCTPTLENIREERGNRRGHGRRKERGGGNESGSLQEVRADTGSTSAKDGCGSGACTKREEEIADKNEKRGKGEATDHGARGEGGSHKGKRCRAERKERMGLPLVKGERRLVLAIPCSRESGHEWRLENPGTERPWRVILHMADFPETASNIALSGRFAG